MMGLESSDRSASGGADAVGQVNCLVSGKLAIPASRMPVLLRDA
jgi:hypothetical protein